MRSPGSRPQPGCWACLATTDAGGGGTRRASRAGLGEAEGRPCLHSMNCAKLGLSPTEASRVGGGGMAQHDWKVPGPSH